MLTDDELKNIDDMANMYRSEFGTDNRYDNVKAAIIRLKTAQQVAPADNPTDYPMEILEN